MNDRQRHALEHPLDQAQDQMAIEKLRRIEAVGNDLLVVILAVDR